MSLSLGENWAKAFPPRRAASFGSMTRPLSSVTSLLKKYAPASQVRAPSAGEVNRISWLRSRFVRATAGKRSRSSPVKSMSAMLNWSISRKAVTEVSSYPPLKSRLASTLTASSSC
jgi:hypothetical protein